MKPRALIEIQPLDCGLVRVRLPPFFWLLCELRGYFRRIRPDAGFYTYTLRGKHAARRLARWAAEAETRAWQCEAKREQERRDAEWEAAGVERTT